MRTHAQIIADSGGPAAIKARLTLAASIHTVRSWATRDSIPGEYWASFAAAGAATLEELAVAASARKAEAA